MTAVEIRHVVARPYTVPAREVHASPSPLGDPREGGPVRGALVGASDGTSWGWWGPVGHRVAGLAAELFSAVRDRAPAPPEAWARRARRATRHAHVGLLGVAAGALELACWDLAGVREQAPVWALSGASTAVRDRLPCYATCFGMDLEDHRAPAVAAAVGAGWSLQKWRPPRSGASGAVERAAVAAGGGLRLALDFGGSWDLAAVLGLCDRLDIGLAWVEEPLPPDELHLVPPGGLPFPHAAGEHAYGPADAAGLRSAGVEVWQPDAVFCGGYANLRVMAEQAQAAGARCLPHGGGLLPALHAAASGAEVEMGEYHLLLEPRRQAHLAHPVSPLEPGGLDVPARPGWAGPLRPELVEGAW